METLSLSPSPSNTHAAFSGVFSDSIRHQEASEDVRSYQEASQYAPAIGHFGTNREQAAQTEGWKIHNRKCRDEVRSAAASAGYSNGAQRVLEAMTKAPLWQSGYAFDTEITPAAMQYQSRKMGRTTFYDYLGELKAAGVVSVKKRGRRGCRNAYRVDGRKVIADAKRYGWACPRNIHVDCSEEAVKRYQPKGKPMCHVGNHIEAFIVDAVRVAVHSEGESPYRRRDVVAAAVIKHASPENIEAGRVSNPDLLLAQVMERGGSPKGFLRSAYAKWTKRVQRAESKLMEAGKIVFVESVEGRNGYTKYALPDALHKLDKTGQKCTDIPYTYYRDEDIGVAEAPIEAAGEADFEPVPLEAYGEDPSQNMDTEICPAETQTVAAGNEAEGQELAEKVDPITGGEISLEVITNPEKEEPRVQGHVQVLRSADEDAGLHAPRRRRQGPKAGTGTHRAGRPTKRRCQRPSYPQAIREARKGLNPRQIAGERPAGDVAVMSGMSRMNRGRWASSRGSPQAA